VLQLNKILRKGCKLNAIIAMNKKKDTINIDQYPMSLEFSNVFQEELPRLSPKIELELTVELKLGTEPVAKAPSYTTTLEL